MRASENPGAEHVLVMIKDIHDLNGVQGDGCELTAVTFIIYDHHEQITAGNLLDNK